MQKFLKQKYQRSSLADKIRISFLLILVPVLLFAVFALYSLWAGNRRYEDMIHSVADASGFSLDFQKDFDYETYLLIVGNKTIEQSTLPEQIVSAKSVIDGLKSLTDSSANRDRLDSVEKYLTNLDSYRLRIEENLEEGNRYEDNILIWENDVQIVTSLIRETVFEYIYYEIQELQLSRARYQSSFSVMLRVSLVVLLLLAGLILLLSWYLPASITRPLRQLEDVTNRVAQGDLAVRSHVRTQDEVGVLSDSLNGMIDKINNLLSQVTREQIRLRKAEFLLLQSQINPHFLYNTLDAIIWLAESGQRDQVVSMVTSLSAFFRSTLNQGRDIVTVRDEVEHVQSYLEIQQIRYEDILTFRIDIPESLMECPIPKITLQPLVENALYHGIKNRRGGGSISILGARTDDGTSIMIQDHGAGMSKQRLQQVREAILHRQEGADEIYGLYNVNERIRLNFGPSYGLDIQSVEGEGTTVTVHLPEKNQPGSENIQLPGKTGL